MKKYITIATLLAAGTAFANAENTWIFESVDTLEYTNGGTYAGFVFTLSQEMDDSRVSSTGITWADSFTLNSISFQERSGYDYTAESFYLYLTDSENVVLGISEKNTKNGDIHSVSFSNVTINAEDTYYAYIWNADQQFPVGVGAEIGTGRYFSKQIAAGGGRLSTDSASQWGLLSSQKGVASQTYAPNMEIVVTPVPEPSAFGLLAGLGALALVASRRRRK